MDVILIKKLKSTSFYEKQCKFLTCRRKQFSNWFCVVVQQNRFPQTSCQRSTTVHHCQQFSRISLIRGRLHKCDSLGGKKGTEKKRIRRGKRERERVCGVEMIILPKPLCLLRVSSIGRRLGKNLKSLKQFWHCFLGLNFLSFSSQVEMSDNELGNILSETNSPFNKMIVVVFTKHICLFEYCS